MDKLLAGSTDSVADLSSEELFTAYERWKPRLVSGRAKELLGQAHRRGIFAILPNDPDWPVGLSELANHQPLMLWGMGAREALGNIENSISIVGSRTVTPYGNWATTEIVTELTSLGVTTISGGALGVDSIVHRSTLRSAGTTIAVMAGGLFNPYPAANYELFDQIGRTGLLLSEMTPDSKPTRWRFLQRNRLIAALGKAVIVTEAGYRSGSINTTNHALELNRTVLALPGPINSPNSAGCNRLIAEGRAEIITDASEVLIRLGLKPENQDVTGALGSLELRLLDVLTGRLQEEVTIASLAGFSSGEFKLAVGGLELLGLVKREGNLLAKAS
jgi:DNA processing protein